MGFVHGGHGGWGAELLAAAFRFVVTHVSLLVIRFAFCLSRRIERGEAGWVSGVISGIYDDSQ